MDYISGLDRHAYLRNRWKRVFLVSMGLVMGWSAVVVLIVTSAVMRSPWPISLGITGVLVSTVSLISVHEVGTIRSRPMPGFGAEGLVPSRWTYSDLRARRRVIPWSDLEKILFLAQGDRWTIHIHLKDGTRRSIWNVNGMPGAFPQDLAEAANSRGIHVERDVLRTWWTVVDG